MTGSKTQPKKSFWNNPWILGLFPVFVLILSVILSNGEREEKDFSPLVLIPFIWLVFGFVVWLSQSPNPDPRLEGQPTSESANLSNPTPPGVLNRIFLGFWGLCWAFVVCMTGIFGIFAFMFLVLLVVQAIVVRRMGRQEDVARVLNMAVVQQSDLGSAVRALAKEVDEFTLKNMFLWVLSWFVLPGYVLVRQKGWRWDARLRRLAHRLECGQSLPEALAADPGLVPAEYRVSPNREKGLLALAGLLDGDPPVTSGVLWLEIFPRLMYPVVVIVLVCMVLTFHKLYIAPKIQKIFQDFGMADQLLWQGGAPGGFVAFSYLWLGLGSLVGMAVCIIMAIAGPTWRWHLPLARWFYRPEATGNFLKRFGLLLERGHNEVETLDALGETTGFPFGLRTRIKKVLFDVESGKPMLDSLSRHLGLGRADRALLESSQRAHQLPWVLREVGERMIRVTLRRVMVASQFGMVICVILIGVLVGLVCLSLFYPLIQLIEALA